MFSWPSAAPCRVVTGGFVLLALLSSSLAAQETQGSVVVRVTADSVPVSNVSVRSGRTASYTSAAGTARLTLPAGPRTVLVSRIGFTPDTIEVNVVRDSTVEVEARLTAVTIELEEITITTTRGDRRLEDEPVRVEVLAGEDVAEKTEMRPSDLTKLLSEVVGLRMQPAAGGLGGTQLRIQGLRGQYTGILSDGLPLYGSRAGDFGVMQLAPVDLKQAEVIKGAATSLYGPSALGGLLNLVSRRPEQTERQLVLNQSLERGTDVILWGAQRLSPPVGVTLYTDFHTQARRDLDGDRWADVTGFDRFTLRPRLFVDGANGDGLLATAGVMTEDRRGGFIPFLSTGEAPATEDLSTQRVDGGVSAHRASGGASRFTVKASGMHQWTSHQWSHHFPYVTERDSRATLFGEVSYSTSVGKTAAIVGTAWQWDRFRSFTLPAYYWVHSAPALFGQLTVDPAHAVSLSGTGRCDFHNLYGRFCSPRVSLLLKLGDEVNTRLSAGTGFFAPTPMTDETESVGLASLIPSPVRAERARTASADVNWSHGPIEISGTLARSRLENPVAVIDAPSSGALQMINVSGPTDITAGEVFFIYDKEPLVVTAFYGYLYGTEQDPEAPGRRETGLTPRHSFGADVAFENLEKGTWIALEAFSTSSQALWDNPYRTRSPRYFVIELLVSQRFGHFTLYLNGQNLLDERQTRHESLLLPGFRLSPFRNPIPATGGRLTNKPWAPIEGRVISFGTLIRW